MQIRKSASAQSVEDFRAAVAESFETNGAVLLNLIEALAVGPRPGAPVEVSATERYLDALSGVTYSAARSRTAPYSRTPHHRKEK